MENSVMGLTPYLTVSDAKAAIEFYKKAFGAEEVTRHGAPGGDKLMHVHLNINGNALFFSDDFPEFMGGKSRAPQAFGGSPVTLHLQVENGQETWDRAIAAGGTAKMPFKEQFWGDLYGQFTDPFGHEWSVGQSVKNPTKEELEEGAEAAFEGGKS
ncbi:VOC family protein [Alloacidobacterium sp.]|uniref:VOC family protein n=1 Tax=Alloacidobacterium sp. TaxID=2951999 RepID=UPI002D448FD5|nr:VOC family protein [Alloacidobacterium sp.]HYK36401.1 VOC family protein [Alloacidobacterium sp.]